MCPTGICLTVLVTVCQFGDISVIKAATTEPIPETFQTEIEVVLWDEESSILLSHFYDGQKGRQSVRIMEAQKEEKFLINNKKETVYFLSKSKIKCEESKLTLERMELWKYILFGEKPLLTLFNSSLTPISSDPESGTKTYKINNIAIKNGSDWVNFDVTFQIREEYWSTATGWKNPPVKALVSGIESAKYETESFHYKYEFFNFGGTIKDMSVFEIPKGMICEDLHTIEKFPDIGKNFHVKVEKIVTSLDKPPKEEEWWFQSDILVARHDYKPWNSDTTVFEVHDYIDGVQYKIDPASGHCSINPLAPWRNDIITDVEATDVNGVRYLKMNSPNQLFQMNGNYFKKGLTTVRGIPCDTYITYRQMTLGETTGNITLEYYILSSSEQSQKKQIPIKLLVTTEDGQTESYNFISYEDSVLDFSVFDVTPCYSERAQLHFQISFLGKYDPDMRFSLMNRARQYLKDVARVSFLRVQGITLDYDTDYLYLYAILLGRDRPIELFTKLPYGCDKPPDDHIIAVNASSREMCAQLCVDRSHNVSDDSLYCNSFYFNIFQPEGTVNLCRLSSLQKVNDSKFGSEEWECYYRSVRGEHKFDITSTEAWENIKANVSKGGFNITLSAQKRTYFASSAEINFGFLYEIEEPDPPQHFYMKAEIIVHEGTEPPVVQDREVWYDYQRKILRIHSNFPSPMDDLSSAVMDRIYDFNTGFMYIIGSKCWSRSIVNGDTEAIFYNETLRNASSMKDPKSILHMNGKVIFSGQKRVRGILSDVLLYHLPFYTPMNHINYTKVLHRVFFKTRRVYNGSEKAVDEDRVPVRIETNGLNSQFAMTENIFNFVTLAPELKNFDISRCYRSEEIAEICMNMLAKENIPKGYQNIFLNSFQNALANVTQVSPLRFQNLKLLSETKEKLIIRFFVLPLTKEQGKIGMVSQKKLLQLIETQSKSGNVSLSFQHEENKVYRAVSSGTNRQYPICSKVIPKTTTTEQPTTTPCPTLPTVATVTSCPTLPTPATVTCPTFTTPATPVTKSSSATTGKTIISVQSRTPTSASAPTKRPTTSTSPTTESTDTKSTERKIVTESIKTTEVTTETSVNNSSLCSTSQLKDGYGSHILSQGEIILLSFGMLSIGLLLGVLLHRYRFKNKKKAEEWLKLTDEENIER